MKEQTMIYDPETNRWVLAFDAFPLVHGVLTLEDQTPGPLHRDCNLCDQRVAQLA